MMNDNLNETRLKINCEHVFNHAITTIFLYFFHHPCRTS